MRNLYFAKTEICIDSLKTLSRHEKKNKFEAVGKWQEHGML